MSELDGASATPCSRPAQNGTRYRSGPGSDNLAGKLAVRPVNTTDGRPGIFIEDIGNILGGFGLTSSGTVG